MNEDSDTEIHFKKKRTTVFLDDSSSSDDSSFDVAVHRKKKAKNYIPDSESESDSSIEYRKKKRVAVCIFFIINAVVCSTGTNLINWR